MKTSVMARSQGYRASKENKAQVALLRAKLAECRSSQWQRAGAIMQDITALTSKGGTGPSGSRVEPRSCKYCGYYGHTKQHCKRKQSDEDLTTDYLIAQWSRERTQTRRVIPSELPWYQRPSQADWFDEAKIPWYMDRHVGPLPLSDSMNGGDGKWVRIGSTVKIADE